jgi:hypothetical protein
MSVERDLAASPDAGVVSILQEQPGLRIFGLTCRESAAFHAFDDFGVPAASRLAAL